MISRVLQNLLFVGIFMTPSFIHTEAQASEVQKLKPTWQEVHEITSDVCKKIDRNSFDVICGISVGGLVPIALFSIELEEKNVTAISAKSYQGYTRKELVINNGPEVSAIKGKRVLLVDDIADSGKTIMKIKQHLLDYYGAKSVEVAVLYLNPDHNTSKDINIWGRETTQWVEFPWEVKFESRD